MRTFKCAASFIGSGLLLLGASGAAQERGDFHQEGDYYIERVDKVVEVGRGGTLRLEANQGGIEVNTWDREAVRVVVEKRVDVFTEVEAREVLSAIYPGRR